MGTRETRQHFPCVFTFVNKIVKKNVQNDKSSILKVAVGGFRWFQVVLGGCRWFLGGFRSFHAFSNYPLASSWQN